MKWPWSKPYPKMPEDRKIGMKFEQDKCPHLHTHQIAVLGFGRLGKLQKQYMTVCEDCGLAGFDL